VTADPATVTAAAAPGRAASLPVQATREVDPSLAYLAARLAVLEEHVRAAVAARRARDPDPDDRFRGLYVSDAQATELAAQSSELGGWSGAHAGGLPGERDARTLGRLGRVDARAPAGLGSRTAGELGARVTGELGARAAWRPDGEAEPRLRRLERVFGLEPLDVEMLLVALAPDLEPRFEKLYGYLHDDVSRRRASVGLALRLCGAGLTDGRARARLGQDAPLVAGALLIVEEQDRPSLTRSLRVPDRVIGYLLGDDRPDGALLAVLDQADTGPARDDEEHDGGRGADTGPRADASRGADGGRGHGGGRRADMNAARGADAGHLVDVALRSGADLVYLRDGPGSDARHAVVAALAGARDRPVVLDASLAPPDDDLRALAAAAAREARLSGGPLVVGPADVLAERGGHAVRIFADLPCRVVLHGSRAFDPSWARRIPLTVDLPLPGPAAAREAWREALGDQPGADAALDGLARFPFRLGHGQIVRAAAAGLASARAQRRVVTKDDLAAGVRAQNAAGLERLARRIHPAASWESLVLPERVVSTLRGLVGRTRLRDRVLDGWGLAEPTRGRGVTALFTGDSGTGKTLSAEVVAGELGLDLYVIDLSRIVDKYIGETEKNLDRVFTQADGVNGLLLFDEADALFGKRSEVRDAHDRYANVEIAYLLQRMELFDGVAILTTNLRANVDEAFLRRLDLVVDFPMPETDDRRRLWGRHLRPGVPVASDVDLDFLAERFRISGGNIRNIVVTAAFRAAAEDRAVSMADLIHGTAVEYRKLGHLSTEAEFGPYAGLVPQ
jgi:hypothetical protein